MKSETDQDENEIREEDLIKMIKSNKANDRKFPGATNIKSTEDREMISSGATDAQTPPEKKGVVAGRVRKE